MFYLRSPLKRTNGESLEAERLGGLLGVGGWKELCTMLESGDKKKLKASKGGGSRTERGARVVSHYTPSFAHFRHTWSTYDT